MPTLKSVYMEIPFRLPGAVRGVFNVLIELNLLVSGLHVSSRFSGFRTFLRSSQISLR